MSLTKRQCAICRRLYKLLPEDTSFISIKIISKDTCSFSEWHVCPLCAKQVHKHIVQMTIDAPKKCEFCEHDRGPKYGEQNHPGCEGCVKYSNFQLRKRMTQPMQYRWALWNGEVD